MANRILGLGVDLVGVERVERAVARQGKEFLQEFLCPAESDECFRSPQPLSSCASMFAAKEALFKALGTGRSGRLGWSEVEVRLRGAAGSELRLAGATAEAAREAGVRRIHLDLSAPEARAGSGMAVALVVLEGERPVGGEDVW